MDSKQLGIYAMGFCLFLLECHCIRSNDLQLNVANFTNVTLGPLITESDLINGHVKGGWYVYPCITKHHFISRSLKIHWLRSLA